MPSLSLRVNDELQERIDEQAERFGISRSEFIRAGIFRMLDGTGPRNQRDDGVIRPEYDRGRHGWEIESELFIPLEAVELTQSERNQQQQQAGSPGSDSGEAVSIGGDPIRESESEGETGDDTENGNDDSLDATRMATIDHIRESGELEADWTNFADTIRDISEDLPPEHPMCRITEGVEGDMGVPDLDDGDEWTTLNGIPVIESEGEQGFEFEFEIQEHNNGNLEFTFPDGVNNPSVLVVHPLNLDPPVTDVRDLWEDDYWNDQLSDYTSIVRDLIRDHTYDMWDIEPDHGHYFHVTVDVLTYSARYPEGEPIMPLDDLLDTAESAMCFDYMELDIPGREMGDVRLMIARQIWNDNAERHDGYERWDDPADPPDVLEEEPPEFEFHEDRDDARELVVSADHFYPDELYVEYSEDSRIYRCAPRNRGPFEVPEERLMGINSRVALFEVLQERAPDVPVADLAHFAYKIFDHYPPFGVDARNSGFFEAVALLEENPYGRGYYIGDMMQEVWDESTIQRYATLYVDEYSDGSDLRVLESWQEHDYNQPQLSMCISQFPSFGDYFDFVESELANHAILMDEFL